MAAWTHDGRTKRAELTAKAVGDGDGWRLLAPAVGLFRRSIAPGAIVRGGVILGELDVLGVLHEVLAPDDCGGVVAPEAGAHRGEIAVGFGDPLLAVVAGAAITAVGPAHAAAASTGGQARMVFPSPLSGRFYARPGPDRPAFVAVGDEITRGQTIGLLEVMKTFNRLTYGGSGLPERARVVAVLARDEDDVDAGTPLLELASI